MLPVPAVCVKLETSGALHLPPPQAQQASRASTPSRAYLANGPRLSRFQPSEYPPLTVQ